MANSTSIIDYLGYGVVASKPTTPPVGAGALAVYWATDTLVLYVWTGSSWTAATAGVSSVGGLGVVVNSGTIEINNVQTLNGTVSSTTTIAPGSGTSDVILHMPTTAGTVTLAAAPVFSRQRVLLDIVYGATVSTPHLGTGFVMTGGITAYTPGTVANQIDRMELMSPDGTHWKIMALEQGATL